jgi:uncharacterized Fe-S center protein
MRYGAKMREHKQSEFILLDTAKCIACWKCQEVCLNNVIGRINLPFHKHARINNGSNCTGCLKCVKICEANALCKV